MKRTLPPLTALVAFEAAARHASFTRAGEELGLSQSAISRKVAYLEHFLGVILFERVRRRVILTERGASYAQRIRAMLRRVESDTVDILSANAEGRNLRICSLTTFATHWLMPRLVPAIAEGRVVIQSGDEDDPCCDRDHAEHGGA